MQKLRFSNIRQRMQAIKAYLNYRWVLFHLVIGHLILIRSCYISLPRCALCLIIIPGCTAFSFFLSSFKALLIFFSFPEFFLALLFLLVF